MHQIKGWLTIKQAASISGYSAEYIRRLTRDRDCPFVLTKVGYITMIQEETLRLWLVERQEREKTDGRVGPRPKKGG